MNEVEINTNFEFGPALLEPYVSDNIEDMLYEIIYADEFDDEDYVDLDW